MSMPTSDERRKVAQALRDANDTELYVMYLNEILAGILGVCPTDSYENVERKILDRLADLIDPTCEMVVKNGHACCGRCGHRLADECEVEEDYYEFRPFCPDCGARVTNGGER